MLKEIRSSSCLPTFLRSFISLLCDHWGGPASFPRGTGSQDGLVWKARHPSPHGKLVPSFDSAQGQVGPRLTKYREKRFNRWFTEFITQRVCKLTNNILLMPNHYYWGAGNGENGGKLMLNQDLVGGLWPLHHCRPWHSPPWTLFWVNMISRKEMWRMCPCLCHRGPQSKGFSAEVREEESRTSQGGFVN